MNICTRDPNMTTIYDMNETATALIGLFEERFVCTQGEPKAFFQIPQRGGDPVRGVYVVYAVRGKVLVEARDYFIKEVIVALAEKAQAVDELTDQLGGPFLYWRIADKVQVAFEDGWFKIYTRICVLDDNLDSVTIDDMVKQEGRLAPICAYSAGAY